MQVVYEDNHLIAINKSSGEIVQGDKSEDVTILDKVREYLRVKYDKKGNVYLGLPHRLDRPTSGLVLLAKTQKALIRLNKMFAQNEILKTYMAITDAQMPKNNAELENFIIKNEKENKSYIVDKNNAGAKLARLEYELVSKSERYFLYKVILHTGRHHQIRAQFANCGVHIKGDLKYGAKRSNPDGSISLHSYNMKFMHPVRNNITQITAPLPEQFTNIFPEVLL